MPADLMEERLSSRVPICPPFEELRSAAIFDNLTLVHEDAPVADASSKGSTTQRKAGRPDAGPSGPYIRS